MKYRVVIIGIGAISNVIARALGQMPNVSLVAGNCRTEAKGQTFAREFSCKWYGNTEQMLDVERPDAAVVCTPSGNHLPAVLACAKRGVHVLCEKPLEISLQRVNQMISACESAGVLFGGIFPQRFNPVNIALRDAIASGRFGSLALISATVPWWRDDAYYSKDRWQGKISLDGGGALFNQGIHSVDLIQWLASAAQSQSPSDQNPVQEVFAYTAVRAHDPELLEVEDTIVINLKFRSGVLGQLFCATSMWPGNLRRLMISGRDGTVEAVEDELTQWRFRNELSTDPATRAQFAKSTGHAGGSANPMAITGVPHLRNITDFFQALDEKRSPVLTAREAAKSVQIVEACYASASQGVPITIF
ncbi:MAG TPA: Gfo/Idh/MocA family oxidoreductase [Tepidisphaeraceae bacterium]|nr:Gfo/Idh/MocA family oxidoreductase [Tepidisphaeraceae bacterium]